MPNKQLTLEQYAAETTEQTTARVIAEVFGRSLNPPQRQHQSPFRKR